VLEPTQDYTPSSSSSPTPDGEQDTLLSRLFGVRRADGTTVQAGGVQGGGARRVAPPVPPDRAGSLDRAASLDRSGALERTVGVDRPDVLREEIGERVSSGFRDLSRLLVAIKETLQNRDGQVQQTLQALPAYLQQVPRIQRAQIECMAQISKQLEHMGSGTRDVLARLDTVPDLLRNLAQHQASQAQFLDDLQQRTAEALGEQSKAIREGLETSRRQAETQLTMIRSVAGTQEDIFSTFQNTQNRALNVFHRAQQQANAQHRETQQVLSKQVEMLVEKVHTAQSRVFWLSIGFALVAAAGLIAVLVLGG
jgi:methyl-accepting chemotaxis protein